MRCEGCGKVPAACKCSKEGGTPWRDYDTYKFPSGSNAKVISQNAEAAEQARQRRKLPAQLKRRDQIDANRDKNRRHLPLADTLF